MRKTLLILMSIFALVLGGCGIDQDTIETTSKACTMGTPQVLADFTYPSQAPENAVVDLDGNVYVSLSLSGEIVKVAPDGTASLYALLPIEASCDNDLVQFMTAMTLNPLNNKIYVNVLSCIESNRGTYVVLPPESPGELASYQMLSLAYGGALLNGIVRLRKYLYTVDSFMGDVYRIPTAGLEPGEYAEVWFNDERLMPGPPLPIGLVPGANGIQKYGNEFFISNSYYSTFYTVPLEFDSLADWLNGKAKPGAMELYAVVDGGGADDFAFDLFGNIYYGTDPFNTVVKLSPDGTQTTLFDTDTLCDLPGGGTRTCIDGSTAVVFDRLSPTMYLTMSSFFFFPNKGTPSLVAVPNTAWGYPLR